MTWSDLNQQVMQNLVPAKKIQYNSASLFNLFGSFVLLQKKNASIKLELLGFVYMAKTENCSQDSPDNRDCYCLNPALLFLREFSHYLLLRTFQTFITKVYIACILLTSRLTVIIFQ